MIIQVSSTCFSSTEVKRISWTGLIRIRHCPASHLDARRMRPVSIEHGLRFCKHTNNVGEYWGLVHGLRQAKASGYSPMHVVGDSAIVLFQLQIYHPSRKPYLALLFGETRVIADDIGVSSVGHHYRAYNKMEDRWRIPVWKPKSLFKSAETNLVKADTELLDNDVNN